MVPTASRQTYIAPTAIVDPTANIGPRTKIWAFSQVGERAQVGSDCVIGNGVYIDRNVRIGDRVRIQNKALLYHGVVLGDDVFIGPGAVFTNDPWPRSGKIRDLRGISWKVGNGASIGANATILPDVEIGAYAVVGAGAVVTKDVPPNAIVYGNPAILKGFVCSCGQKLRKAGRSLSPKTSCPLCKKHLAASAK